MTSPSASSSSLPISVVFLGTPAFACPALKALAEDSRFNVLAVVTQPDRPAGRGKKLTPPPIRVLGEAMGLPVFQTVSIKKDVALQAHLQSLNPEFFVTVAFGQILTQAVLDIPSVGTVNGHASLLPALRGANPIQQAVLQGHSSTGMTTMLTELGVDTGPMLLTHELVIGQEETAGELAERLSASTGDLLAKTLVGMKEGQVFPKAQPHELATHAPKCPKELALLNWEEPADQLLRKILAFNPAPGAATFINGERLKVLRASLEKCETSNSLPPGELGKATDTGVWVGTGTLPLLIRSVQPAGKREMSARDWALGILKGSSSSGFRLTSENPTPQPA